MSGKALLLPAIEVEKIFNRMLILTLVIKEEELPIFDESLLNTNLFCDRNLLQSLKAVLEAQHTIAPTCTKGVVE